MHVVRRTGAWLGAVQGGEATGVWCGAVHGPADLAFASLHAALVGATACTACIAAASGSLLAAVGVGEKEKQPEPGPSLPAVGARMWVTTSGAGPFHVLDTTARDTGIGHYKGKGKTKKWVMVLPPPCVKLATNGLALRAPHGAWTATSDLNVCWVRAQFLTDENLGVAQAAAAALAQTQEQERRQATEAALRERVEREGAALRERMARETAEAEARRDRTWAMVGRWIDRHGRKFTVMMATLVALHLTTALVAWSAWAILKQAREEMRRGR